MRDLVVFLHLSLDGVVEGPKGPMDIGFIRYNEELEAFANQGLATCDTILWGRGTYQMMHQYWPTMLDHPEASKHERQHAVWIEAVEKLVCSTTLDEVSWNNSHLLKGDLVGQIKTLKEKEGGDIVVLGSPRLAQVLLKEGLVDRLRLTVSPVVVGAGLRLFDDVTASLNLVKSQTFSTGVLGLTYQIDRKEV